MSRVVATAPSSKRVISQILGADVWLKRSDIIKGTWDLVVYGDSTLTATVTQIRDSSYIYIPTLGICYINIHVTFTTGGVAYSRVIMTLPFPAKYGNTPFAMDVFDTSQVAGHGSTNADGGGLLTASKYDNSNFGLGTDRVVQLSGLYLTA